jgi:hypothetical protein
LTKIINFAMPKHPATLNLLYRLKAHNGGTSDAEISRLLDISRASVCAWGNDKTSMSPIIAARVAKIIEYDECKAAIETAIDRTNDEEEKKLLEKILKRL